MANQPNTAKPRAIKEPTEMVRGYILTEDAELKLNTIGKAMRGIAVLIERDEAGAQVPEMPVDELAAIFYMLSEATNNIRNSAAFGDAEIIKHAKLTH